MLRAAVLVSGGGTNLQALIDSKARGELPSCELALVLSSNPESRALDRAHAAGIEMVVVARKAFKEGTEFDRAVLVELRARNIDVVVLAGFLQILGKELITAYRDRIINVHPSLIPSFCGRGYYGLKVHESALARGVKLTGATVHLVNEIPDGGRILLQKSVEVMNGDTAEILQKRVMEQAEWKLLPQALELLCQEISKKNH